MVTCFPTTAHLLLIARPQYGACVAAVSRCVPQGPDGVRTEEQKLECPRAAERRRPAGAGRVPICTRPSTQTPEHTHALEH